MNYTKINQTTPSKSSITKEILPNRYNSISSTKMSIPESSGNNSATKVRIPVTHNERSSKTEDFEDEQKEETVKHKVGYSLI